jgi:uncharacterized membrane protein
MATTTIAALAFLIGVVAGLRTMTAPAFVTWGARLGWLRLDGTILSFLGSGVAAWLLTALALGELIADKLPSTPNRTRPGPFAARILSGALSGAALTGATGGPLAAGAMLGGLGAVTGTLGGYTARRRLVPALGVPDQLVALAEDVVAVGGALLILVATRGALPR